MNGASFKKRQLLFVDELDNSSTALVSIDPRER